MFVLARARHLAYQKLLQTHTLLVLAKESSDERVSMSSKSLGLVPFQGMQSVQSRRHVLGGGDEVPAS